MPLFCLLVNNMRHCETHNAPMRASTSTNPVWQDPVDSMEKTGLLAVDLFVTYKINQLSSAFERQWTRVMREKAGVSLSEWRILAVLRDGAATFARVVEATGVNKALASRSMHQLEELKLVTISDTPSDARSITLALTGKGQKLLDDVLPVALQRQAHLLSVLTPNERKVLYAAIDKLKDAASEWDDASGKSTKSLRCM